MVVGLRLRENTEKRTSSLLNTKYVEGILRNKNSKKTEEGVLNRKNIIEIELEGENKILKRSNPI